MSAFTHSHQPHHSGGGGGRGRGRGPRHQGVFGQPPLQVIGAPRQPHQPVMYAQTPGAVYVTNQGVVSYPGIPQQQQYFQNMMMRQTQFQPQTAYQQPAAMYNQNQGQTIYTPAQKQSQQTQQPQPPSQQQPKREKKALLIIDPGTNKPINVDGTPKAPSKSPEPEPVLPIVSPTTDAKREFQQKIGEVLKTSNAAIKDDSHSGPGPLLQPSAGPPPITQPTPVGQFPPPEPPQQRLQSFQRSPQSMQLTQPIQPPQPTQQPLQSTQQPTQPMQPTQQSMQPLEQPVQQVSQQPQQPLQPPQSSPGQPLLSQPTQTIVTQPDVVQISQPQELPQPAKPIVQPDPPTKPEPIVLVAAETKSYGTVEKAEVQPLSEEPEDIAKETPDGLLSVDTPSDLQQPPTSVPPKVPEPTLPSHENVELPDITVKSELVEVVDEEEKEVVLTPNAILTGPAEVVAVEPPEQPRVEDVPKLPSPVEEPVKDVEEPVVVAEPTFPSETEEMTQDEPQPVEQPQEETSKEEKSVKVEKKLEENWEEDQAQELGRREESSKEDHEDEKEEGEITDSDEGLDEPESKRTCPPHTQQGGRLKYNREYLLSFRFLKECKEPPKELIHTDNSMLEMIRRHGGMDSIRRDAFLPSYQHPPPHAGTKRNSKSGRSRVGQPAPRVIEIAHTKVELAKSENAWKRASEVAEGMSDAEKDTAELYGKFQGILNKLTPQKFQKLAEQAKELAEKMNTQERMSGCIEKIFLKALEEPVFSVAYAKLCLVLTPYKVTIVGEDGQPKQKSFRALLLSKCQQEFEKDKKEDEHLEQLKAAVEAAETEELKKQRKAEYEAEEFKSRHRSLGNIRFIGELFKFKLLSEAIIHECIQRLLKSSSDGESLECFAKLMTTIGKELDHDKGQNLMERYFNRVAHIIEANRIGSRVKFMLQDVVDLRKNNWVPRKIAAANVPTTIDKIHADHHQQAEEMKRMLATQPSRPRPPPADGRRREDWSNTDSRRSQQQIQPEKIDSDRLKRIHNKADTSVTKRLGPSPWSKQQKPTPEPTPKTDSAKYGGRSSKGKKSTGPATSGPRRPSAQLSTSDVKKQQKDVIAAVALQTGYKPQTTLVVSDALSEEEVEKKSESVYAELCSNLDYKEAQLCVSEMRSPGKLHKLVFSVLNASMEKSPKCRQTASIFFDQLLKEGLLSPESLLKGLNELLEFAEDLECDLPKFWDYIAEVIVHPVSSGRLPLAELKKAHDGVLQSGKIGKLVGKTLNKCATLESISQDRVSRIWSESGLDWTTHLRVEPDDVKYLIEDHSLQFLLHSSPPTIQIHSGSSHDKQQEWMQRLQHKLSSSNDTNDEVVSFIEKNHSQECRTPSFVFSLSCALGNASIKGSGDSAIYDSELFERRCPVLKHFVYNEDHLQEEVIYGLQVTLSRKQHPKDVLDKLFTVLHENDVVGDEPFLIWEERGRENLEGRGVALMSVQSFMTWLKSTDTEDGQ